MGSIGSLILVAAILVGATGLILGIFLGVASEKFSVEVDEKEALVRAALPGNNCGACGFPGCDGCAKAIAKGQAPVNQCPVGGAPVAEKIAAIMGTPIGTVMSRLNRGRAQLRKVLAAYAAERGIGGVRA